MPIYMSMSYFEDIRSGIFVPIPQSWAGYTPDKSMAKNFIILFGTGIIDDFEFFEKLPMNRRF